MAQVHPLTVQSWAVTVHFFFQKSVNLLIDIQSSSCMDDLPYGPMRWKSMDQTRQLRTGLEPLYTSPLWLTTTARRDGWNSEWGEIKDHLLSCHPIFRTVNWDGPPGLLSPQAVHLLKWLRKWGSIAYWRMQYRTVPSWFPRSATGATQRGVQEVPRHATRIHGLTRVPCFGDVPGAGLPSGYLWRYPKRLPERIQHVPYLRTKSGDAYKREERST